MKKVIRSEFKSEKAFDKALQKERAFVKKNIKEVDGILYSKSDGKKLDRKKYNEYFGIQEIKKVKKEDYKNQEEYFVNLRAEKKYVSEHIRIEATGSYDKPKVKVFEIGTNKRLSLTKFRKYFKIGNLEFRFLISRDNRPIINEQFRFMLLQKQFSTLIDSRDLLDLELYEFIYYNNELIKFDNLFILISDYEQELNETSEKGIYKFMLKVHIDYNEAVIDLTREIIDTINNKNSEFELKGYTDKNGNFVLFSS